MNDQNRYRGGSSQRNQNEGRGSAWNRSNESSPLDRGNSVRSSYNDDNDNQRFAQRSDAYGDPSENRFENDRPWADQDRDYRGGSSGLGRNRDYQSEWSGSGASGSPGNYDQDRFNARERGAGGYGQDRSGSSYGSGSYGSGSGSYGSDPRGSDLLGSSGYSSANRGASYSGRGPKGYTRSDERIREDVCERLSDNDDVDASEIEVQVKDRKVTLSGSVQNRRMKHIAEDLAEAVSGVDDVDNRISVSKPFLKDIADRISGNEGEQHYANTGTKNGPAAASSSAFQGANGRA